jgi:hypothetical protein
MHSFTSTHRIEIGQRLFDRRLDACSKLSLDSRIGLDRPFADRERLRETKQVAGRQAALHKAALARAIERRR